MKVETYDGRRERRILLGMIADRTVLGRLSAVWVEGGLFLSQYCNLIGGWCVDYFNRYGKAPGRDIESLYEVWAAAKPDKELASLVERFLGEASSEYERRKKAPNSQSVIDTAAELFNRVALAKLADKIQGLLDTGKIAKAQALVKSFGGVEIGAGHGIDVLRDKEAIRQAFVAKSEPLITYPGALGVFFGDTLERDGFVSFEGPEKRGKTWILLDLAWQAMTQGKKVAFFEVGDLSQDQILRRFMVRASKRPMSLARGSEVQVPIFVERNGEDGVRVDTKTRKFIKPLSWQKAWRACQKIVGGESDTLLRLETYPNSTISMVGITALIQRWEREGWVPDVVVIDYADLIMPPSGYSESRDQINANWKAMRALSQTLHGLVITATQTNADSYDADVITRKNYSEDKRKRAHVTATIGLNQTDDEKRNGVMRLNYVVRREGDFSDRECVYVVGSLPLASPMIVSTF